MATGIKNTCARDTFIDSTCAMNIEIKYDGVKGACIKDIYTDDTFVEGVKLRVLVGSEVKLSGQGVNYYYLLVFMG